MEFDFEKQYGQYSVAELLAIVREPHHYQPEAVQAAQNVLARRSQSEVDAAHERVYPAPKPARQSDTSSIFDDQELQYNRVQLRNLRLVISLAFGYFVALGLYDLISWAGMAMLNRRSLPMSFIALTTLHVGLYGAAAVLIWQVRNLGWQLSMVLAVRSLIYSISRVAGWLFFDLYRPTLIEWLTLAVASVAVYLIRTPGMRDDAGIGQKVLQRSVIIAVTLCGLDIGYNLLIA